MDVQGLKKNKGLMMGLCCVLPILFLFALSIFGFGDSYLRWGIILLCPLMMFFMMRDMKEDKNKKCH